MKRLGLVAGLFMVLLPGVAQAHIINATGAGFSQGFAHPLGGLDHLLAMVGVGLWAAQIGGRARWAVPLAFLGVMIFGAALAMAGVMIPAVELGISASIVILGMVLALTPRLPLIVPVIMVGLFGLMHGHAHGVEMPEAAHPAAYAAGFVLATMLLHAVGLGLGMTATKLSHNRVLTRLAGVAMAATGMVWLSS